MALGLDMLSFRTRETSKRRCQESCRDQGLRGDICGRNRNVGVLCLWPCTWI